MPGGIPWKSNSFSLTYSRRSRDNLQRPRNFFQSVLSSTHKKVFEILKRIQSIIKQGLDKRDANNLTFVVYESISRNF